MASQPELNGTGTMQNRLPSENREGETTPVVGCSCGRGTDLALEMATQSGARRGVAAGVDQPLRIVRLV